MQYYVIGGEFSSLNFHSFIDGTTVVLGPFSSKNQAEIAWKDISEKYKSKAQYRFVIVYQ